MSSPVREERSSYHHGDLVNAILEAVEEIVHENGPTGVSLREAARRAGVSHSAPAHHFGDKDGMIEAFCKQGFDMLAERLRDCFDRLAALPIREQVAEMGKAYLQFASDHPAHYEVMMGPVAKLKAEHDDGSELSMAAADSFFPLALLVNRMADAGLIDPERGPYFATMMWGVCHGIADLWLGGALPHFHEGLDLDGLASEVMGDLTDLFLPESGD